MVGFGLFSSSSSAEPWKTPRSASSAENGMKANPGHSPRVDFSPSSEGRAARMGRAGQAQLSLAQPARGSPAPGELCQPRQSQVPAELWEQPPGRHSLCLTSPSAPPGNFKCRDFPELLRLCCKPREQELPSKGQRAALQGQSSSTSPVLCQPQLLCPAHGTTQ